MNRCALWVPMTLCLGCASTLSSMQTAVPIEPKHVQVTGALGVYVPLGPVTGLVAQGVKQAEAAISAGRKGAPYTLQEEDKQALLTGGIGLAAMPPGTIYEVMVRTGILHDWDVGLKVSTTGSVMLDSKYRLLHWQREGELGLFSPKLDVAIGLVGAKYFFTSPLIEALRFVQLGNFSRWDVGVPIYFSIEWGSILKFWVVPKYLYSRTTFDENLVADAQAVDEVVINEALSLPEFVNTHFAGASVGFGAGYKWVHLMLELTVGYTWCRPYLLGQTRDLGGVTLHPAIGLDFQY